MGRTPESAVIKELRQEVGYTCPIDGCEVPYLDWHHFDPPWKVKEHHNPDGMIALCPTHHREADGGAFTKEQLRELKKSPINSDDVKGKFQWRRNNIMAKIGGTYSFNNKVELQFNRIPIIWFETDNAGYKLLNVNLFEPNGKQLIKIENNNWIVKRNIKDISCPPSGKELKIYFNSGDNIRLTWREVAENKYLDDLFGDLSKEFRSEITSEIKFPFTEFEILMKLKSYDLDFQSKKSKLRSTEVVGGFSGSGGVGMQINFH